MKKLSTRTPKKVLSLTSRAQLENMVKDLEKEITDILACVKLLDSIDLDTPNLTSNDKKGDLEKALRDFQELSAKFEKVKAELEAEKIKKKEFVEKNENMTAELRKVNDSLRSAENEKNRATDRLKDLERERTKLTEQKKELENQVSQQKDKICKFRN